METVKNVSLTEFPFIDAFTQSVSTVLNSNLQSQADPGEPVCVKGPVPMGDVMAVMHLSGESRGFVAVGMQRKTAARIVAALLGMNPETISTERLHDGAEELLNMIAGNAKPLLSETPYRFVLTTPSSIVADNCVFEHKTPTARVLMPFEIFDKQFIVLAALQPICRA